MTSERLNREPSWLTSMADQVAAKIEASGVTEGITERTLIMTVLSEPDPGGDTERWERTCDNCGKYCPKNTLFYTGHLMRNVAQSVVCITFGACPVCSDAP